MKRTYKAFLLFLFSFWMFACVQSDESAAAFPQTVITSLKTTDALSAGINSLIISTYVIADNRIVSSTIVRTDQQNLDNYNKTEQYVYENGMLKDILRSDNESGHYYYNSNGGIMGADRYNNGYFYEYLRFTYVTENTIQRDVMSGPFNDPSSTLVRRNILKFNGHDDIVGDTREEQGISYSRNYNYQGGDLVRTNGDLPYLDIFNTRFFLGLNMWGKKNYLLLIGVPESLHVSDYTGSTTTHIEFTAGPDKFYSKRVGTSSTGITHEIITEEYTFGG